MAAKMLTKELEIVKLEHFVINSVLTAENVLSSTQKRVINNAVSKPFKLRPKTVNKN